MEDSCGQRAGSRFMAGRGVAFGNSLQFLVCVLVQERGDPRRALRRRAPELPGGRKGATEAKAYTPEDWPTGMSGNGWRRTSRGAG